jgi:L,D-transpeptidase YbiS
MLTDYAKYPRNNSISSQRLGQPDAKRVRSRRRLLLLVSAAAISLLLLVLAALLALGWFVSRREPAVAAALPETPLARRQPEGDPAKLANMNEGLRRKLAAMAPKGNYIVIDTANNRVFVRNGESTVKEMIASCGSGNVLEDPVKGRKWTFDTPRGEFKVLNKITNPVWIKPDWAFIEEGEPIPASSAERAEANMMGDYALGIGKGYFIHGTLYKRLLGRNVSHGCVRLGDEDLKYLYDTVPMGTKVFIY